MIQIPDSTNIWTVNGFLSAKLNFCIDATGWTGFNMHFDLKQTDGGALYTNYLGAGDYTKASSLRVLVNDVQIGRTYNPTTTHNDLWKTHYISIDSMAGKQFTIAIETRNVSRDSSILGIPSILDNAYIDNVCFFPSPLAVDDSSSVKIDSTVTVDVLLNDNNHGISGLKFALLTMPQHGTVIVNSDTTISYTPNNAYLGNDSLTYNICYTIDTTICSEAKVRFRVHDNQGVQTINGGEYITLYPNPLKSLLTVECSSLNICKVNITITDIVGKKVISEDEQFVPGMNRKVFNLGKDPNGIYFVSIKTPTQQKIFKITKE